MGIETMRAWADLAGFPCSALWEYIWILHPFSPHPLDPNCCPWAKGGGSWEGGLAGRAGGHSGEKWAVEWWEANTGPWEGERGGGGGSGEMQTKCWPRVQSRKTDSRGSLEPGSL